MPPTPLLVELEAALNALKDENARLRAFVAAVREAVSDDSVWVGDAVYAALAALDGPDAPR